MELIKEGFYLIDFNVKVNFEKKDGDVFKFGDKIVIVLGFVWFILIGEWVILNLF